MKARPILFSGPMVRAILAGKKTVTRRIVKGAPTWADVASYTVFTPPGHVSFCGAHPTAGYGESFVRCPYGTAGDQLWIRETWGPCAGGIVYLADDHGGRVACPDGGKWKSSIHMPRWASRLSLEIVSVRVGRLQDITEEDAMAEGITCVPFRPDDGYPMCDGYMVGTDDGKSVLYPTARRAFIQLWEDINGEMCPWASNPWCWVVNFKRVEIRR